LVVPVLIVPGLLLAPGCSSSSASPSSAGDGGAEAGTINPASPPLLGEDCDPIAPGDPMTPGSGCGFPYPSNVWTKPDTTTATGMHQFYGPTTLPGWEPNKHIDPKPWARKDGFSPGAAMMIYWPDVGTNADSTVVGCPSLNHIDQSVSKSSPTIIMEYDSGALGPHWDELDHAGLARDGSRAFFIRPAIRLKDQTRYVVAVRHVQDSTGKAIAPAPEFQALRDGTDSADVSVGLRRKLYADILGKLKGSGIDPSDLQVAWDFTTASRDSTTADMVSVRDQALAAVGTDGPAYTITTVTPNPNPYIRQRIEGEMTVPLFMKTAPSCTTTTGTEKGCPGSTLNRDANGKPAPVGTTTYPFLVQIPNSVVNLGITAPILQEAHGLFGSRTQGEDDHIAEICDRLHYIEIAVDLVGMNTEDGQWIPNVIVGDLGNMVQMFDRLHQGFANELMAMRMMMGKMSTDPQTMPAGKPTIDTAHRFYRGDSQGGISGGVYMAISTDVTRGWIDNTGAPYNLVLDRSSDFSGFFALIVTAYHDPVQDQLGLDLIQQLWDNAEPDGYLPYITDNPLPGTPSHNVLISAGLGDQQVSPIAAEFEARSVGAKIVAKVNREVYGLTDADGFTGNGYVEYNFWLPPTQSPLENVAPPLTWAAQPGFAACMCNGAACETGSNGCTVDPHDALRQLDSAQDMADQFFKTGQFNQTCANGGPCAGPMNWWNLPTLLTPATAIEAGTAPADGGIGDAANGG
jgi:hypothetical protein